MWVISSYETNVPRAVIRGMRLTERHLIRPLIGSAIGNCIMQHAGDIAVPSLRVRLPASQRLIRTLYIHAFSSTSRACMSRHYHALSREQDLTLARSSRGLQLSAMRRRCFYRVTWLLFLRLSRESLSKLPASLSLLFLGAYCQFRVNCADRKASSVVFFFFSDSSSQFLVQGKSISFVSRVALISGCRCSINRGRKRVWTNEAASGNTHGAIGRARGYAK